MDEKLDNIENEKKGGNSRRESKSGGESRV